MTHFQSAIPAYRAYFLGLSGRIVGVEVLPAIDDDDAKFFACALQCEHGIELWERGRRLAVYPRSDASIDGVI
jgi:hypothetical protein